MPHNTDLPQSDRGYEATKWIKQGRKSLAAPFDEMARWIASAWQVTVLNVIHDRANSLHAPRLQIILEHEDHVRKFRKGANFDRGSSSESVG
jgi:hypothetical protein